MNVWPSAGDLNQKEVVWQPGWTHRFEAATGRRVPKYDEDILVHHASMVSPLGTRGLCTKDGVY